MAIRVDVGHQATTIKEEATPELISTIDVEFEDSVTYVPLTRARTLPCGHNFNEDTIRRIGADRQGNKSCPNCRSPFRETAPNTAIRNVVNARLAHQHAASTNPSVEAMAQLERAALNSPSMEATAHYEKGKRFAAQGDFEQAIQACLAAITLSPDFAKAHAYLHFLLDQQSRGPSAPQSVSNRSSAQGNEGIGSNSSRRNGELSVCPSTTRPARVEERSTEPRRNPPLAARVSSVPSESRSQELGLVDALKQYAWGIYQFNALIFDAVGKASESAGTTIGTRIREVSERG